MMSELNITGATLLNSYEARHLPRRLRNYHDFWWTCSRGRVSFSAVVILTHGRLFELNVEDDDIAVRPALTFNTSTSNIQIGETFEFGGHTFEIVNENTAFCLDDIGKCAFRNDQNSRGANIYDRSDVKRYIANWLKQKAEEEE